MKLKLIAAAALLAATGAANAAIDNGATGNGELFFTAWDGANSYTYDLNTTIDAFQASVSATGTGTYLDATLDTLFTTYLSTANMATMVWNIVAVDALGARRILDTYSSLPTNTVASDTTRSTVGATQSFIGAVNTGITAQGNGNSAVFAANTPGYANNTTGIRFGSNNGGATLFNINNTGTLANSTYDSGLGMVLIGAGASGVAATTYSTYVDEGFAVRAYFDASSGRVTIAAVPEPETYALMLAGLALMGGIARRRRNQA